MTVPSFKNRSPASSAASAAARGASRKQDTKPEVRLRRALWHRGHRYRKNAEWLRGKPDIVFVGARLVVFCDGDFWHGRDWETRREKLLHGHNAAYWLAKIGRNMERDREVADTLERDGWTVVRFWEGEISEDLPDVVRRLEGFLPTTELHAAGSRPGSLSPAPIEGTPRP